MIPYVSASTCARGSNDEGSLKMASLRTAWGSAWREQLAAKAARNNSAASARALRKLRERVERRVLGVVHEAARRVGEQRWAAASAELLRSRLVPGDQRVDRGAFD